MSSFFTRFVTGRVACKQMMPKDERRSIKEGEEGKEGKESNQGWPLFTRKEGVSTTGKFRLVAGNTIRAEARYTFLPFFNVNMWLIPG